MMLGLLSALIVKELENLSVKIENLRENYTILLRPVMGKAVKENDTSKGSVNILDVPRVVIAAPCSSLRAHFVVRR